MSKRNKIRCAAFSLAVITVLSSFAVIGAVKVKRLERQQTASVQRSISELDEYVSSIDETLSKGVYATTKPMIASLSTELWREATGAKTCLSSIPTNDIDMSQTYKFLSQLGELVMALNRRAASGEKISDDERNELISLQQYSKSLSASISSLRDGVYNGTIKAISSSSDVPSNEEKEVKSLSSVLADTEQTVTDFPSLIYDGPFSDHLADKQPAFLSGKQAVSQQDAQKICADICSLPIDSFTFSGEELGTIETYVFNSDTKTVAVTKQGGVLSYMLSNEFAGESKINYDEAKAKAKEFLDKIGFTGMEDTYHSENDGICTVNFAYNDNGVICYPDLIKVNVSMADGAILSVDARNYILSHTARNLSAPTDFNAAKALISPLLQIINSRLAVIPTDGGDEIYCYEFHCVDSNGQEVLVYINCEKLEEAEILLLLYSDNGVLTK